MFYDQYSLKYDSVHKVTRRYKNIIYNELKGVRCITRIRDEFNAWSKSKENKNYWLDKIREQTSAIAHIEGAEYLKQVVQNEMNIIRQAEKEEEATEEERHIDENTDDSIAEAIHVQDHQQLLSDKHWVLDSGENVTNLFITFFTKVKQFIENEGSLYMESHVQELSCLNHILVLKPLQHSDLMRETFSDDVLNKMYEEQLNKCMNSSLNFTSEEFLKLAMEIKKLNKPQGSTVQIAAQIMIMAASLSYEKQRVLIGIAGLVLKLPQNQIKQISSISETELWSIYFDPLLSAIISDSQRNTILRWLNKEAEDDISMRPDAAITQIDQLDYGGNIGYGEVKIAQPTCDKAALCLDFLRIANLNKESLDSNCLKSSFGFQIHGFHITFYLTRLDNHKIYTMTQIGKLDFPRSLSDLSSFVCPQNLQLLLQLTDAFWTNCKKCEDPTLLKEKSTKSISLGLLYHFLDPHKNRRRDCPDHFGN